MSEEEIVLNYLSNNELHIINNKYSIMSEICKFYDVNIATIRTAFKRNKTYFNKDEFIVLTTPNEDISQMVKNNVISAKTRNVTIFNYKGIIKFAFILFSDICTQIKEFLLVNCNELYLKIKEECKLKVVYEKKYEKELGYLIHKIFGNSHNVEDQVGVNRYKIDFVIDKWLAVECDEHGHESYDKENEVKREEIIRKHGYEILRYDTRHNDMLGFMGVIVDMLKKHSEMLI